MFDSLNNEDLTKRLNFLNKEYETKIKEFQNFLNSINDIWKEISLIENELETRKKETQNKCPEETKKIS